MAWFHPWCVAGCSDGSQFRETPSPPYSTEWARGWTAAAAFVHDCTRSELTAVLALAAWDGALTRVELLEMLAREVRSLLEARDDGAVGRLRRLVQERLAQLGTPERQIPKSSNDGHL